MVFRADGGGLGPPGFCSMSVLRLLLGGCMLAGVVVEVRSTSAPSPAPTPQIVTYCDAHSKSVADGFCVMKVLEDGEFKIVPVEVQDDELDDEGTAGSGWYWGAAVVLDVDDCVDDAVFAVTASDESVTLEVEAGQYICLEMDLCLIASKCVGSFAAKRKGPAEFDSLPAAGTLVAKLKQVSASGGDFVAAIESDLPWSTTYRLYASKVVADSFYWGYRVVSDSAYCEDVYVSALSAPTTEFTFTATAGHTVCLEMDLCPGACEANFKLETGQTSAPSIYPTIAPTTVTTSPSMSPTISPAPTTVNHTLSPTSSPSSSTIQGTCALQGYPRGDTCAVALDGSTSFRVYHEAESGLDFAFGVSVVDSADECTDQAVVAATSSESKQSLKFDADRGQFACVEMNVCGASCTADFVVEAGVFDDDYDDTDDLFVGDTGKDDDKIGSGVSGTTIVAITLIALLMFTVAYVMMQRSRLRQDHLPEPDPEFEFAPQHAQHTPVLHPEAQVTFVQVASTTEVSYADPVSGTISAAAKAKLVQAHAAPQVAVSSAAAPSLHAAAL